MKENETTSRLAEQLHQYVRDRAEVEGVGYELSIEFFEQLLSAGVTQFFGVSVDKAEMKADQQEPWPGYLSAWVGEKKSDA